MGSFIVTFHIEDKLLTLELKRLKRLLRAYVDEINLPTGKMDITEVAEMQEIFQKLTAVSPTSDLVTYEKLKIKSIDNTNKDMLHVNVQGFKYPFAILTYED